MNVQQCMKPNAISVGVEATVQEAAHLFVQRHIGALPVVDKANHLAGILHLRDLLKLVMPAFVDLLPDFDFVQADFGVYEDAAGDGSCFDQRNGNSRKDAETPGVKLCAFASLREHLD